MNLDDLIKSSKVGTLHLWAVQLSFAVTEIDQPNRNDQELLWGVKEEMWAAACTLSHQHVTPLQMYFIWLLQVKNGDSSNSNKVGGAAKWYHQLCWD